MTPILFGHDSVDQEFGLTLLLMASLGSHEVEVRSEMGSPTYMVLGGYG